jgi:hypothetical protein
MPPANTTPPQISGYAVTRQTLTAAVGVWTPPPTSRSVQWERCDQGGGACVDLAGENALTYLVSVADLGATLRVRETASNGAGSASSESAPTVVVETPLYGFSPKLKYDSQESYRADSAQELTDSCWVDAYGVTHSNDLEGTNNVYADSCDQLTIGYLGRNYPTGAQATSDDNVSEFPDEIDDFQRMHAMPQYANRIYGRVHTYPDGESILQYWFWYYNQPNFVFLNNGGGHQGDWEGIQIRLDSSGHPVDATYDQHGDGERCDWSRVGVSGSHPIVFVADKSHASYFTAVSGQNHDSADGNGEPVTPAVEEIFDGSPEWLFWPGMWGGSTSSTLWYQRSPTGPGEKSTQWEDPRTWQSAPNISTCSVPSSMRALRNRQSTGSAAAATANSAVPAPHVRAHRVGKRAVVKYCFSTVPTSRRRRPAVIEVSVQSANKHVPPYTTQSRAHLPCGSVSQPIGRGRPPFHVLVSAWSRTGARSRVVTAPLR